MFGKNTTKAALCLLRASTRRQVMLICLVIHDLIFDHMVKVGFLPYEVITLLSFMRIYFEAMQIFFSQNTNRSNFRIY